MGSRFSDDLIFDILGQARSDVSIRELRRQYVFLKSIVRPLPGDVRQWPELARKQAYQPSRSAGRKR